MFLIKKPTKITAYTYDKSVLVNAPVTIGVEEKPSWLKKLKTSVAAFDNSLGLEIHAPTARSCPAIRDFISEPIQLKMWGDLDISIFPNGQWTQYTRPGFDISAGEHSKVQFGEAYNNRIALKLNSPWFFVANDNTKFMFMEAHYSTSYFRDKNILFPPGIIEYKLQHSTNVHLSVPIPREQQIINLKLGMPLVSMFPLTENPVEVETKLIPANEWNDINSHLPKTFIGRYFKLKGKTNL
jgi:hypothetical protein